jgi:TATA-box binding protein (TBP) (component of TFIID and TFIIIB)
MKINSTSAKDIELMKEKLNNTEYYKEHIIDSIDNPFGRIKFKDVRKISIGICKKDILNHRSKEKSAFYNCFVLMIRMKVLNEFKEYHVKVFNTGKVTVPGVKNENSFVDVISLTINILQPYVSEKLEYVYNTSKTILINTNFNCGYYINREKLNDILCQKYNIQCELDSCNYPGVRCIFYYDPDAIEQKGYVEKKNMHKNIKKISFMIFRTGSVLISGAQHNCRECVLTVVYEFLKKLLHNEYFVIRQTNVNFEPKKEKQKKIRKKKITVNI